MPVSIDLFGPLVARYDDEPLGGFEYNKVRALLAYLAMEGPRQHSRGSLGALLWPDQSDSAARQNLSQALTTLRKVLRDRQSTVPLLVTTTDSVGLNPAAQIEVDVARFNALISEAESHRHRGWHLCPGCAAKGREAAALYRDDFLAQLYVSDSAPFEEWALLRRERLRQRMLSTLERLILYAEWRGEYVEALEYARRQVEMEPLRDSVHRTVMRLLALDGQQAAALAQYEYLRRMLDSELGEEPEEATIDLAERIKSGTGFEALRRHVPPPSTLPESPTPIVGREREIEDICAMLDGETTRVLTVVGPPGVGKTRLAFEVAAARSFLYEHGVHVVELASVDDADRVVSTIAQALDVPENDGRMSDALIAHLRQRHMLLVLDNFEHVLDAATLIGRIVKACPGVSILVTSRMPLQLRAEQQYPVGPLPLPAPGADASVALHSDAVRLLVERARMVQPGWNLPREAIRTAVAICERAEGLPLAIELLAPRLKAMTPGELLGQLERRLSVTGTAPRDAPTRHRTLRLAIQWSYDRLGAQEQRVFAHLGVFAGGGSTEAIAAVSGVCEPLAALEALRDASLIQSQSSRYEARWVMLETIREYAVELLEGDGLSDEARARHADYFAQYADLADKLLVGSEQPRWSALIAAESQNIRSAMRWSLDQGNVETTLVIGGGIWRWWWQRGLLREGLHRLEQALAQPHDPSEADARAMRAAGIFAMSLNEYPKAKQWFEASRNMAMHFEEVEAYAAATTNLGLVLRETGELDEASTYLAESISIARASDPVPSWLKFPTLILARVRERLGEFGEAERLFEEALRLNREVGDAEGTADALQGVAFYAGRRGDYAYARQCCDESLRIYTTLEHQAGTAWAQVAFGHLELEQGLYADAFEHYRQSLTAWQEREDLGSGAEVLDYMADALCRQADYARAVTFASAAQALRTRVGAQLSGFEQSVRERLLATCRTSLGTRAYDAAWTRGLTLTLEQAARES